MRGIPLAIIVVMACFNGMSADEPSQTHVEHSGFEGKTEDWSVKLEKRANLCGMIRNVDGHPRFFIDNTMVPPVFHDGVNETGENVNVVTAPLGGSAGEIWKGIGEYDFAPIDSRMKSALQYNPNGRFIIAVSLGPYRGWGNDNPTETTRDQNGFPAMGRNEREYFGEKQDDSHHEIFSYYSLDFKKEMSRALQDFMAHVKKQSYYKTVIGFLISGGLDGSWSAIGQAGHLIDYCPGAVKSFRNFMKERYQTETALRKAINDESATFAALRPPSVDERVRGVFRNPETDRLTVDYSEFLSDRLADLLIGFGTVIKENAGKPVVVVARYGDVLNGMGHGEISGRKIHESPHIDMLASANEENASHQPGDPGDGQVCLKSLSLHNMIWLRGLDPRAWAPPKHILMPGIKRPFTMTLDHFKSINERKIGAMIAKRMGARYVDLSGIDSHDSGVMKNIARCRGIYDRLLMREDDRFRPGLAVVVDEESCHWVAENSPAVKSVNEFLSLVPDSLAVSGVPFDAFQLDDLLAFPELTNYKVYIFLNCFFLTGAERDYIGKHLKKEGKTLVWLYAPGYIDDTSRSVENIFNTCGFKVATNGEMTLEKVEICADNPLAAGIDSALGPGNAQKFWIESAGEYVTPLGRYVDDGKVAAAIKNYPDWNSIYLAMPDFLPPKLINNIAAYAAAYVCCEAGPSVSVNDDFISIHGTRGGRFDLNLPRPTTIVRDAFTNDVIAAAKSGRTLEKITIDLALDQTRWFLLE